MSGLVPSHQYLKANFLNNGPDQMHLQLSVEESAIGSSLFDANLDVFDNVLLISIRFVV